MPVSISTKTNHTDHDVTTSNFSHTIGGVDVNRLLVVAISYNPSSSSTVISGITWGGQALTRIVETVGVASVKSALWRLINPDTGTKTVTVTFQANVLSCVIEAVSFENVDQINPTGWTDSVTTSADTISAAIKGVGINDMVLDCVAARKNSALTLGLGQISQWQVGYSYGGNPNSNNSIRGAGSYKTGLGDFGTSWTDDLSLGQPKALTAARIIVFVSAPPPNPLKKVTPKEPVHLTGSLLRFLSFVRIKNETERIQDAILRKMAMLRIIEDPPDFYETEEIADAVLYVKGTFRIIDETENVTEDVTGIPGTVQQVDELVGDTEDANRFITFLRIFNETENIPDLTMEVASYIRILNSFERIYEQRIRREAMVHLFSEQVNSSETNQGIVSILRILRIDDFIQAIENTRFSFVLLQLLTSTINIMDSARYKRILRRVLDDLVQVRERVIRKLIKNIIKVLNNTVNALDQFPAGGRKDRFGNPIPPPVPPGIIVLNLIFEGVDAIARFLSPVLTLIGVLGNPPAVRAQHANETVHMSESVLKFVV